MKTMRFIIRTLAYFCFMFLYFDSLGQFQLSNLRVVETFDDKFRKNEPAKLLATFPKSDNVEDFYSVDVALGLTFLAFPKANMELNLVGEWHRNTQIGMDQHVQQLGINLSKGFGGTNFTLDMDLNAKYSHDLTIEEGTGETGLYSVYFSPYDASATGSLAFLVPYTIHKVFNGGIYYMHRINFGAEWISQDDLVLFNLNGSLDVYPAGDFFMRKLNLSEPNFLQIRLGYTVREELNDSETSLTIGNLFSWNIGVNYRLGKGVSMFAGFESIDGPDPLKGLEDQKFSRMTLKFKLGL